MQVIYKYTHGHILKTWGALVGITQNQLEIHGHHTEL